jgi:histidyl-tRNA synthetase
LIGGGRYNGLIKTLGGKNIPGVGWAGGIERIMLLMKDIVSNEKNIHLAIQDPTYKKSALEMYNFLIKNNFGVYWNYKYNLKKSLSLASEKKAQYIIIVGEQKQTNNNYALKNLKNGEQKIVDLNNILDHIK